MSKKLVAMLVLVWGAGCDDSLSVDTSRSCEEGIAVEQAALRTESIARLRTFFGRDTSFDDGQFYFRDIVAGLPECPLYDQAAVYYVASIEEGLVPAEIWSYLSEIGQVVVAVEWGLNGNPYIFFNVLEDNSHVQPGFLPPYDIYPISFMTVISADVTQARASEIFDEIRSVAGDVPVDFLDTIGIITVGPRVDEPRASTLAGTEADRAYYESVLMAAARVRELSPELGAPEWSLVNRKFELIIEPGIPVDPASKIICPELLRTATREIRANGYDYVSLPSFPTPFGDGWKTNTSPSCLSSPDFHRAEI